MLMTADELRAWTLAALPGASCVYYLGYLARTAQEEAEEFTKRRKANRARRLERLPPLPLPKTPTLDLQTTALELAGYRHTSKENERRWELNPAASELTLTQRRLGVGRYEYIARRRLPLRAPAAVRGCLGCGANFRSEGAQNRLCPSCLRVAA